MPREKQRVERTVQRLPTMGSPQVRVAQQRAMAARTAESGRMSTLLTDALRGMIGTTGKLGA